MINYTIRPLRWVGEQTPPDRRRSRYTFKAGWSDTLTLLGRELEHLGASNIVMQLDVRESDLRLDGMLRASAIFGFPGVRVLFDSKHGPLSYQTDSCTYWQHNVRSIALGLEALRAVDRYGITRRGEQYKGWKELTTGTMTPAEARAVITRGQATVIRSKPTKALRGRRATTAELARTRTRTGTVVVTPAGTTSRQPRACSA